MGRCVSVRKTSAVHMKIIISTTDRLSPATNNYVDEAQLQLCYFVSLPCLSSETCKSKPEPRNSKMVTIFIHQSGNNNYCQSHGVCLR